MSGETYPPGITSADHIAYDMRKGRFPSQSTIAEFLAEAEAETDKEVLARVMSEPTFEAVRRAEFDAAISKVTA